jgi:hypothetical protein
MMSDPERMLESDSVDPEVRELLRSLRNVSPEPGTGTKSWSVMASKIAALPVLATASKSAAQVGAVQGNVVAAGAAKAVAVKVAAGALATTLLGAGILVLRAEHAAPPSGAKPVPAAAIAPAVPVALVVAPAEPATANPTVPAVPSEKPLGAPNPGAAATRSSQLDAEASLLAKARGELRSGNARAAEARLFQLQSTFPRGQLGQERDVLAVEVLAANGNMAAAKRKARAFIAAHPTSPHSAKLERLVGER